MSARPTAYCDAGRPLVSPRACAGTGVDAASRHGTSRHGFESGQRKQVWTNAHCWSPSPTVSLPSR